MSSEHEEQPPAAAAAAEEEEDAAALSASPSVQPQEAGEQSGGEEADESAGNAPSEDPQPAEQTSERVEEAAAEEPQAGLAASQEISERPTSSEPQLLSGGEDVTKNTSPPSKTGPQQPPAAEQQPEGAAATAKQFAISALQSAQAAVSDLMPTRSGETKTAEPPSETATAAKSGVSPSSSAAVAAPSTSAPPAKAPESTDSFSFADYDIVGLDLDCTLTRFNTEALMKNVYLGLMRYLVNVKEYDKILLTDKDYGWDEGKSFLQRGLVLDAQKGNVVKLDSDGGVMKAAHGKVFLSAEDLKKTYGDERSTAIFKDYAKTFREVAGTIYCVQDIFILPALLANANLVQLQDKNKATSAKDAKEGKASSTGNYKTWADVFAGLLELYRRERFADKTGEFFSAILVDTKTYVKPTTDKFKAFMKNLRKEKKILYLLTGSNFDYTNFLCEYAIGKDWKDYFDTVICHAGKPGFFTGIRPFYVSGRNVEITDPLNHLAKGEVYMMGNWRDLYAWFSKQLDKKDAKAVYVGDNMVLDIISAAKFTNCKAIAVMEELDTGFSMASNTKWGSIFAEKTLWATMLRRYSLVAVPSIDTLAENPLDHRYKTFTEKQDGYHPPVSTIAPVPK